MRLATSTKLGAIGLICVLVAGVSGCSSPGPDKEENDPFFPTKSVAESSFRFDRYERSRALRAYKKLRAAMLFELVIDREGKVIKVRTLRTELDDTTSAQFRSSVHGTTFSPAKANDPLPFRALFFPLQITTSLEVR